MSDGPLGSYLRELEHALRERGHQASRIVEEAREHLADAVEDGLRRGLAREDAEREAVERFGPPDLIAAQAPPVRSRLMARLVTTLDTVVGHWRWITATTAVAALVTSVASYYWLPTRYRSESIILVVSQPLPPELSQADGDRTRERLQLISQTILSRPRLEWVARDFGLDTVQQIRRSISVEVGGAGGRQQFKVSFEAPNPQLAMRVTERIASMIVEENLRQHEVSADGTSRFLEAEIDDVRRRLVEQETRLEVLRAPGGSRVSRADVLPFEVLQDRYRDLLVKREDARSRANLARYASGFQFQVIEAARLPDQPVGPSRASVNASGTLAGLALAIAALVGRRTPPTHS